MAPKAVDYEPDLDDSLVPTDTGDYYNDAETSAIADEQRLNQLGYKQVYNRSMTPFEQWAYTFSYTAPSGFIIGYYGYMYQYGGPVLIVWGFLATSFGTCCMAWAMSEIISAFPALGSVYFWVYQLLPRGSKWAPFWSWYTGWVYLLGSFCGTALNEYLLANFIAIVVLLATGGNLNGGYEMSVNQIFAVTAGVFFLHFWVSITNTHWLGRISSLGAALQVTAILAVCITLLAVAPKYQSASFVFTTFVNSQDDGKFVAGGATMVVLLGLPYYQSILTGFEVGSHVVEEVKTAAIAGPRAMCRSLYVTAVTEFFMLMSITFCIQDPTNILSSDNATGGGSKRGASQIFYDVFEARWPGSGTAGAITLTSLGIMSLFFGNITNVTLTARMAYAMARDDALPFYNWVGTLTPRSKIPLNATIITCIFSLAATLPSLGSSVAFTAITAMSTITAYLPYTMVLTCRHLFKNGFTPGPFSLGKWSLAIGAWGSIWGFTMSVLFCLPPVYPVDGSTFNYAPVSFVGCTLVGLIYWYTSGRYTFHGPKKTYHAQKDVEEAKPSLVSS